MYMKWMVISTKTVAASLTATNPRDPTQSELACVFLAVKPICFDTAVRRTEHARTVMSRLSLSVAWLRNALMSLSALAGLFCPESVRWQHSAPMCHKLRSAARNTRWGSAAPILTYCSCPVSISLHAQLEPQDAWWAYSYQSCSGIQESTRKFRCYIVFWWMFFNV